MGRSQEKDRKRRQAAATCQRLDGFLVPKRASDQLVTPDPEFTQLVAVDDQLTPTSSECCSGSVERVGSSSTATYVEPLRNTCCEVHDNEAQRAGVDGGNQQCHHANTSDHDLVDDIGKLFFKTKSPVDFCKSMQALSAAEKYNLLTNHKSLVPTKFSSDMYWWPQPSFSSCLAIRTPVDGLQRASGWCRDWNKKG